MRQSSQRKETPWHLPPSDRGIRQGQQGQVQKLSRQRPHAHADGHRQRLFQLHGMSDPSQDPADQREDTGPGSEEPRARRIPEEPQGQTPCPEEPDRRHPQADEKQDEEEWIQEPPKGGQDREDDQIRSEDSREDQA